MKQDGSEFADALKEAQELGFAERDPSADIEGYDACRKIAILSSLAYGGQVDYEDIYTEGIIRTKNFFFDSLISPNSIFLLAQLVIILVCKCLISSTISETTANRENFWNSKCDRNRRDRE